MSVITDNVTIIGDGVATPLATNTLATVNQLLTYGGSTGTPRVLHVSDPLTGGTFSWQDGNSTTLTFSFDGASFTNNSVLPKGLTAGQTGQMIYLKGITENAYYVANDGYYILKQVSYVPAKDGNPQKTTIIVNGGFITETTNSAGTISIFFYQNRLQFKGNIIKDVSDSMGISKQGFVDNSKIIITGTCYSNGVYKIFTHDSDSLTVKNIDDSAVNFTEEIAFATIMNAPDNPIIDNSVMFKYNGDASVLYCDAIGDLRTKFQAGQTIVIQNTQNNNGVYLVRGVLSNRIIINIPGFVQETHNAKITGSLLPYTHAFNFNPGGTASTKVNDAAGSAPRTKFSGFSEGQQILVSNTTYNDGLYTILHVDSTNGEITINPVFETENPTVTLTIADGGATFPAAGGGYWQRQYDPLDGLSVSWFGAKGDGDESNPTDDTKAIQKALYAAVADQFHVKKVVIPPGVFLHSTLYVPTYVLLTGSSTPIGGASKTASRLLMTANGGDSIRFIDSSVAHVSPTLFGNCGLMNLDLYGNAANINGWAISFRNAANIPIIIQDMNFYENIHIRNYPQGGIEIPQGGSPMNFNHIKGAAIGGPIIYSQGGGASISFDNISADHSAGGGIWIDGARATTNILVSNLKSEGGPNAALPNQPNNQINPIICTNSDPQSSIILDNPNHQSTTSSVVFSYGAANFRINSGRITVGQLVNNGAAVKFAGTLPTNLVAGQTYYVINSEIAQAGSKTTSVFDVAATSGSNTPIDLSPGASAIANTTMSDLGLILGPVTFLPDTDFVQIQSNMISNGDAVKFATLGTFPPKADLQANPPVDPAEVITTDTVYYVINSSFADGTTSFQISYTSTGSTAVSISQTASGVNLLPGLRVKPGDLVSLEEYVGLPVIGTIENITTFSTVPLQVGDQVKFYTSGLLPVNLLAGQLYYVASVTPTVGSSIITFSISASLGGPILTFSGNKQAGVHRLYRKNSTGNVPKITWRGAQIRVGTSDVGLDPQIISNTNIPYTTTEGKFNVVQQNYGGSTQLTNLTVSGSSQFTGGLTSFASLVVANSTSSPLANLTLGGVNKSANSWGTSGINLRVPAATYTDSTDHGSTPVPVVAINAFTGGDTLNSNAATTVTYTQAATVYIGIPPVAANAGTPDAKVAITNAFSLITQGLAQFRDYVSVGPASLAPTAMLQIQGSFISKAPLDANGIQFKISGATVTDGVSPGGNKMQPISNVYLNVISKSTIASKNAKGESDKELYITDAATLFIAPPVAQTPATGQDPNIIITNLIALKLGGTLKLAAGTTSVAPLKFIPGVVPATGNWALGDMVFTPGKFLVVPGGTTPKRIVLSDDVTPLNGTIPVGNGVDYTVKTLVQGDGITINNETSALTIATTNNYATGTGDPSTTDIPAGTFRVWQNTTSGDIKLWANKGGALVSVALS